MSTARETVLARVRSALTDVAPGEPARWDGPGPAGAEDAYRDGPAEGAPPALELFCERVADYRAEVVRSSDVAADVAEICARHGARRIAIPGGLPDAWLAGDLEWVRETPEDPLSARALDAVDGVLTGAAVGIAETGTIALDHGPGQGRRSMTLVPDLHLCVVRAEQVVTTVPEALRRIAAAVAEGRPITLLSGPSATSDIELERVEGVHGPRRLVVLVVD